MKTVILCIGNRDGGDDAVGPLIADKLTKGKDENRIVIDAGIAPENFTGVVKKHHPDALIIIDAVDMNLSYGAIRRVPPERIGLMHVSTHGIPLSVLIKYLPVISPLKAEHLPPARFGRILNHNNRMSLGKLQQEFFYRGLCLLFIHAPGLARKPLDTGG